MGESRHVKIKKKRRKLRVFRLLFNLVTLAIILYIIALLFAMFGGGGVSTGLRQYEFIDTPVKYLEQSFTLVEVENEDGEQVTVDYITITITEDKIYFEEEEIALANIEQIVEEGEPSKAILVDDGAKRVTYAEVYDELERLGLIIEEE